MTPPILDVRDVCRNFILPDGEVLRAVRDVSFTVAPGETVALVGGSGSGKSTLARIALCLSTPSSGEVFLAGERIDDLPPRRLRDRRRIMQPVFQDSSMAFNPRRTVHQSLAMAVGQSPVVPRDAVQAVTTLLNQVNLRPADQFLGRFPHELSGGQRQRLGIARALAVSPQLIVADEPLSGADVSIRGQVLNLLLDLQAARNVAYLFITHDMAVARSFAHRVLVMQGGQVVEQGPAKQIFSDPQHDYTRLLVQVARAAEDGGVPVIA